MKVLVKDGEDMTIQEVEILAKLLKSLCILKGGQTLHINGHAIKVKLRINQTQKMNLTQHYLAAVTHDVIMFVSNMQIIDNV